MPEPLSPHGILDLAWGLQRSRVLLTAHELGLFPELQHRSIASSEAAHARGTDERAAIA